VLQHRKCFHDTASGHLKTIPTFAFKKNLKQLIAKSAAALDVKHYLVNVCILFSVPLRCKVEDNVAVFILILQV